MESVIQDVVANEEGKKMKRGRKKHKEEEGDVSVDSDEELRKIVENIQTSIKVVGTGGAGNNTVNRLVDMGIRGGDIIAVNTDALDLLYTKANTKILIGASITGGIGAGNNPDVGEQCADVDVGKISEAIGESDMVFITCGLGGGTGTGSAPVIGEVAREAGALTIAVVTLPFTVEGKKKAENALSGLKKLRKNVDTVIVIPNDRLLDVAPNLPLDDAFKVSDELLSNSVKGITEMITEAGLVNLDFADVRAVMQDGGTAMIGLGNSTRDTSMEERARESVEKSLRSPLLDTDVSSAKGALINITGSQDMTLEEAEEIVKVTSENIDPAAEIIWGAQIDEELDRNVIKTLIILAGVKVPTFEKELEERIESTQSSRHTDMGLREV